MPATAGTAVADAKPALAAYAGRHRRPSAMPQSSDSGAAGAGRAIGSTLPPQRERLAWACYFLLGAGMLAPWNAVISAADYMEAVYPGRHMDRLFTVAYLPTCLLMLAVMLHASSLHTSRYRILTSYAGFALIMAAIPLVDVTLVGAAKVGPSSALVLLLFLVVLIGVLDGLAQGALYGDVASLPANYTHAVVGGTASSGLLICIARILTKAAAPDTRPGLRRSSAAFFLLASALSIVCFLVYGWLLPQLPVVAYWRRKRWLNMDERVLAAAAAEQGGAAPPAACAPEPGSDCELLLSAAAGRSTGAPGAAAAPVPPASRQKAPPAWAVQLPRTWRSCLAVFMVYVVTLSIFPGFLAEDVHSATLGSWYPIWLFTFFNLADLVGKNLPFCGVSPSPSALLLAALLRAGFLPAFLFAARLGAPPVLIGCLTFALGLSNGLLTALIQTLAPVGLGPDDADTVAGLIVTSLVAGLTVGAFCGWIWLLG